MSSMARRRALLTLLLAAAGLSAAGFGVFSAASQGAHSGVGQTEEYCLACHADPDLAVDLPSGERLSLFIDPQPHARSVHTRIGIECKACHAGITTYPHPDPALEFESARELSRAYYQACRACHQAKYSETLDSIHQTMAEEGRLEAPVCTDCHGAHDMLPPGQPRAAISQVCEQCHASVFQQYAASVHGQALFGQDNPDVPVCTDCHGVHDIQDPRTAQFRVDSPELCAGCHADPALMARYGLSADVYNLYMVSWHGVEVAVYRANWPTIWHETAVCTDCHGIHDILPADHPDSSVHPGNLLTTCQECHPGAGPNWTDAWTGHHPVSLERTPFVFYTAAFYDRFASLVLWLSGGYVMLQILRSLVERIQRSLSR
jgi:predicted CXXCH cytochrome family protein